MITTTERRSVLLLLLELDADIKDRQTTLQQHVDVPFQVTAHSSCRLAPHTARMYPSGGPKTSRTVQSSCWAFCDASHGHLTRSQSPEHGTADRSPCD
eukprot:scaffold58218_cov34-Tisochrysis_lutea.AAC.3